MRTMGTVMGVPGMGPGEQNKTQAKTSKMRGRLSAYVARAFKPVAAALDALRGNSENRK